MDVSAVAPGAGTPAPAAPEVAVQSGSVQSTAHPEVSAQTSSSAQAASVHGGLAPVVAKVFGSADATQPVALNVSYRILDVDLGEIVTVFTDPRTGKEVAQFPPSVLIGFAQFFDQESGATLDRTA